MRIEWLCVSSIGERVTNFITTVYSANVSNDSIPLLPVKRLGTKW